MEIINSQKFVVLFIFWPEKSAPDVFRSGKKLFQMIHISLSKTSTSIDSCSFKVNSKIAFAVHTDRLFSNTLKNINTAVAK